jgi:hypothetical protein
MSASVRTRHVREDAPQRPHEQTFTASADGKNPSSGKTASAG